MLETPKSDQSEIQNTLQNKQGEQKNEYCKHFSKELESDFYGTQKQGWIFIRQQLRNCRTHRNKSHIRRQLSGAI